MSLAAQVEEYVKTLTVARNYREVHAGMNRDDIEPVQVRNALQRLKMKGKVVTMYTENDFAYVLHITQKPVSTFVLWGQHLL